MNNRSKPAPADTDPAPEVAAEAALEQPTEGGSYTRLPDGTLTRAKD